MLAKGTCAQINAKTIVKHAKRWYIFPQIKGLGHSVMAQQYAITSQEEAKAYLEHPLLGSRLRECTGLVMNVEGRSAEQIFYYPDNLKFRSSMTLFMEASTGNNISRVPFLSILKVILTH